MKYKVIDYSDSATDYEEVLLKKIGDRELKIIMNIHSDKLVTEFDNSLKRLLNLCFDGIRVYGVKCIVDILNIELFMNYLYNMPPPYNTDWEAHVEFDKDSKLELSNIKTMLFRIHSIEKRGKVVYIKKTSKNNHIEYPSSVIEKRVYQRIIDNIMDSYNLN